MGYYDEYDYYEPSAADIIIREAQDKLKDVIKGEIAEEIKILKKENEQLKKELEEYKNKERDLRYREFDIAQKEKETVNDMYRKKFSELLKPLEDKITIYTIGIEQKLVEKCDKCNEKREIEYKSKYGDSIFKRCECNKYKKVYFVDTREIKIINLFKNSKNIGITPSYNSKDYDNTYCSFKLEKIIDELSEEYLDEYKLVYEYGFKSKDICQKYVDYLNCEIE